MAYDEGPVFAMARQLAFLEGGRMILRGGLRVKLSSC
jgi:hypothetical protein